MEKFKCKICKRAFANGRGLGGHMRSHVLNRSGSVYVPPQKNTGSTSSTLSSESFYGLRENPKRSVKLADPRFSFLEPVPPVQGRESEAESVKNPVLRRSERFRNLDRPLVQEPELKRAKPGPVSKPVNKPVIKQEVFGSENEPVSSVVSDTTTDEDVAFCLMMMKRDTWMSEKVVVVESDEDEGGDDEVVVVEEGYESDESMKVRKVVKNNYKCDNCKKLFKSYQALGGHRASHKRTKTASVNPVVVVKKEIEERMHECPVCYRVFSSGQALGGHKRSHVMGMGSSSTSVVVVPSLAPRQEVRNQERVMIDLNLPAPVEDEDEMYYAISEADFAVNSSKH